MRANGLRLLFWLLALSLRWLAAATVLAIQNASAHLLIQSHVSAAVPHLVLFPGCQTLNFGAAHEPAFF